MKNWGHFTSPMRTEWCSGDPRKMITLGKQVYVDPRGKRWEMPEGSGTNGATTWWFRWLFPAYVGMYRRAAVFHDWGCGAKEDPSDEVHQMFYEAMRCDGVPEWQAWLFWYCGQLGVRSFPGQPVDEVE